MRRNLLAFMLSLMSMPATMRAELPTSPLVIAAEDGAGPWGQADGTGCGNDIVRAAYAAVKVPARLEVMPYARAKNSVISGGTVGCFGMAWTPDMAGKIVFADKPLYTVTAMLIQNNAKPLNVTNVNELPLGTKVGTVFEYEYPPVYYDLVKQGRLVPLAAYGEVFSLKNLDLLRVDAALVVIDELKSLDYLLTNAGLAGRLSPALTLGSQGTYLGFSLAHPQSEYARAKFNEGYAIISRDGTLKKLIEGWKAKQH